VTVKISARRYEPSARTSNNGIAVDEVAFSHRSPLAGGNSGTYYGGNQDRESNEKLYFPIERNRFPLVPGALPAVCYFIAAAFVGFFGGVAWLAGRAFGYWRFIISAALFGAGYLFIHLGLARLDRLIEAECAVFCSPHGISAARYRVAPNISAIPTIVTERNTAS
jgi:hypothetical protein